MTYNHRRLEAGDEFDVEKDIHARVLVVRGRAKIAPNTEKTAPKRARVRVASMPRDVDVFVTAVVAPRRGPGRPRRVNPESSS